MIGAALLTLLGLIWWGVADALGTSSPAVIRGDAWTVGVAATLLLGVTAALLWRLGIRVRQREAALAHEQVMLAGKTAQLEAVLAGMTDGIMMVDAELRLLAWNERFPDFTGVPRHVLQVGTGMETILRAQAEAGEFGPVDIEAEVARRMALLRAGGTSSTMLRLRPGGRVLELRRNPLPGGGFVTLYTDVTARQEAEQHLRQTEKMAAIGRLTAGIVHDFNNLLASILGNAELLRRDLAAVADPSLAERMAAVVQSGERGAELVRRLLAFARQQPLAPVAVDLNAIITGMHDLLGDTIGAAVTLRLDMAEGLWPALVDPVQLEHVILNLAINARDAMPLGGTLTIVTGNQPRLGHGDSDLPAGDYVALAVRDTGTGMSEEVKRSAFEPFFTTKPVGEGTGLGLSQVYGLATQSGGGVELDSTPGEGTTVTVLLPRADMQAAATGGPLLRAAV